MGGRQHAATMAAATGTRTCWITSTVTWLGGGRRDSAAPAGPSSAACNNSAARINFATWIAAMDCHQMLLLLPAARDGSCAPNKALQQRQQRPTHAGGFVPIIR